MNRNEWLRANSHILIGCVKVANNKIPLKGESKERNWLFSETNKAADRIEDCIKFADSEPDNNLGVLLPDSIMIADLDNKEYNNHDGVARWKELSDIPATMKSTSGVGEHVWLVNSLGYSFKSNYKAISGLAGDAVVELFGGSKQYIKLPDHEGFDWSELDLDNLPSLPEGFLNGIHESKPDAPVVIGEVIPKYEYANLKKLFVLVAGYIDMPHRSDMFPFIAAMKGIAVYNSEDAEDIKGMCMWKCKSQGAATRYKPSELWDAIQYKGKSGVGVPSLVFNSKPLGKPVLRVMWNDLKGYVALPKFAVEGAEHVHHYLYPFGESIPDDVATIVHTIADYHSEVVGDYALAANIRKLVSEPEGYSYDSESVGLRSLANKSPASKYWLAQWEPLEVAQRLDFESKM